MLIQIEENSVALTPFGSLVRINPAKVMQSKGRLSSGKSWRARLSAELTLLFRRFSLSLNRALG
jgi:hypothetical protein